MAIAKAKDIGTGGTGASAANTYTITVPTGGVASGNTITVVTGRNGATALAVTITDTRGNTYVKDLIASNGTAQHLEIWRAKIETALQAGDVITFQFETVTRHGSGVATEWQGFLDPVPLDQTAIGSGASNAPATGTTATTTQADELLLGGVCFDAAVTASAGTNYTGLATAQNGSTTRRYAFAEYRIVNATGAYTATANLTGSAVWAAGLVTYKAATGGVVLTDSGAAISVVTASGPDALVFAETGEAASTATASGSDALAVAETGGAISAGSAAGADALLLTETGAGVASGVGSGTRTIGVTVIKAGSAVSVATASGTDALTLAETGRATSPAQAQGADAVLLAETGSGVLVAAGSGARATGATVVKTGGAVSVARASGADAVLAVETGAALLAGTAFGVDALLSAETGAAHVTASGRGTRVLIRTGVTRAPQRTHVPPRAERVALPGIADRRDPVRARPRVARVIGDGRSHHV